MFVSAMTVVVMTWHLYCPRWGLTLMMMMMMMMTMTTMMTIAMTDSRTLNLCDDDDSALWRWHCNLVVKWLATDWKPRCNGVRPWNADALARCRLLCKSSSCCRCLDRPRRGWIWVRDYRAPSEQKLPLSVCFFRSSFFRLPVKNHLRTGEMGSCLPACKRNISLDFEKGFSMLFDESILFFWNFFKFFFVCVRFSIRSFLETCLSSSRRLLSIDIFLNILRTSASVGHRLTICRSTWRPCQSISK